MGTGVFAIGVMAICVIYSVIARYFFGISHTFLEEFITTVFAFSTFWGMGICIIENEHVGIDTLYERFPPLLKKIVTLINHIVLCVVLFVMVVYGWRYAAKFGAQISMGMRIPMMWMYGMIPLCSAIALFCALIKFAQTLVLLIRGKQETSVLEV